MKFLRVLVLIAALVGYATAAGACPNCKDQVPTQKTADGHMLVNPYETQRAYALSIYVLLSAVYGLPCTLCFVMWRSMKGAKARNRALRAQAAARPSAAPATLPSNETDTGLPAINWSPAREEAGS